MYLIPQEVARDIATFAILKYPEMVRLFSAKTDEEADRMELESRRKVAARTGMEQVGRAVSIFAPLLLEHEAITWYINRTQDYSLRKVAPEILSAEEAALWAQREMMISGEEFEILIQELIGAQNGRQLTDIFDIGDSFLHVLHQSESEEHPPKVCFTVERRKLLHILKLAKASMRGRSDVVCELTLKNGIAVFVTPGTQFELNIQVNGSAKVTFDFQLFNQIITSYRDETIRIEVMKDIIMINTFKFRTLTTFFEDDKILRSIQLPINYKDSDLIALVRSNLYSDEEIMFNHLAEKVDHAQDRLEKNMEHVWQLLREYGVSRQSISYLINSEIEKKVKDIIARRLT